MEAGGVGFRVSVAPMFNCTDRHFRFFVRKLTRRTLLYTPMISAFSLLPLLSSPSPSFSSFQLNQPQQQQTLHSFTSSTFKRKKSKKKERYTPDALPTWRHPLFYLQEERPLALQLGGSDPELLADCALLAQTLGYDQVNLNVGCPSSAVQAGKFGAVLMKDPHLVAQCVKAMRNRATKIPITVKHRIGVDEFESFEFLKQFVEIVFQESGCEKFIVHARKAYLNGLSPAKNRTVPPLVFDLVYKLKKEMPKELCIEINGGVKSVEEIENHLANGMDGVMIGRTAYENPWLLRSVDTKIFGDVHVNENENENASETENANENENGQTTDNNNDQRVTITNGPMARAQVLESMIPYFEANLEWGENLWPMVRHLGGLFTGVASRANIRQFLFDEAKKEDADISVIHNTIQRLKRAAF